jgi:4-amino-4-deoxy-L-arabinose transferase-like glycosyltransferase
MFDMLLTATVVGALLALWTAGRNGGWRAFLAYGFCTGLGLLTKGPIVLLFTLPAALLGTFWIDEAQRRGWLWRIGASVALAAAMGLAWALRAAYLGGPEYAEMLLWKQSAGRIASSFAHARPFWFYGPILLAFLAPLLAWRPAWAGVRKFFEARNEARAEERNEARAFLLCWIVPAILGLSLISGKQLHYLLPIVPALALLISLGLRTVTGRIGDMAPVLGVAFALVIGLIVLAMDGVRVLPEESNVGAVLPAQSVPLLIAMGLLALGALAVFAGSVRRSLIGLAVVNLVLVLGIAIQARDVMMESYDLQPVADALTERRRGPIAMTQRSRGEFGFLARLTEPVAEVSSDDLSGWLAANPSGIAIVRSQIGSRTSAPPQNPIVYSRNYRRREVFSLVTGSRG